MEPDDYPVIAATIFAISIVISLGELVYLTIISRKESFKHAYAQPLKNILFISVVTSVLPIISTAAFAILGSQFAPTTLSNNWYAWPIGLLIFEFWYWVQHYLGHKVRFLWCIHAPHHAPDTLTSLIGLGRNILELPYLGFFLGFMTAFCGVPVEIVFVISLIDGFWGKFLHISPKLIPGRYGPFEYFLQTPSYHRGHHAKNLVYMDTNYNSLTLFWDWVLGTLQPLQDSQPAEYGITREVDSESWFDVQLGETKALWRDLKLAPGLKNKLCYLLMPPGWSHTGEHKTVTAQRQQQILEEAQKAQTRQGARPKD
ncbi:MAG: sterol desaturase/sphingolipid hydroxylase (fatty acid hydroxylase superfamily) [Halioglobus sp.]